MYRHTQRSGRYGRNSPKIHESKFIRKASAKALNMSVTPSVFTDLSLDAVLHKNIARSGYVNPTPIQEGTIAPILAGKDVIGIANTGTGKTAAFLIPLLDKITKNKHETILIIVPTRELAAQIQGEMRSLAQGMSIYSTLCIGGASMGSQISELRRDPHFVIGTPGRLKDLLKRNCLVMSHFTSIVLDEVDRMLDMGFVREIQYLISLLPKVRQSLFFSATISPPIRTLIQSFTTDAIMISVKTQDTTENVEQDIVRVKNGASKIDVLEQLLKNDAFKKVLIFGRTKFGVERLSTTLFQKGFKVASIHGDKPQIKRSQAIRQFKDNVVDILVATDVASRGIDISDITHVINYDQPATYDDYVHRIGRTGRLNKMGIALTFVD